MIVIRNKTELDTLIHEWKGAKNKIGLVPTMGALHDGHLSLVDIAKANADKVVASIFVNPTQFAPQEDFARYPRDEDGDIKKLKSAGAHAVYIPTQDDMYPVVSISDVKAGAAAQGLEGDLRPAHFDGVVTVVARLFRHAKPDIAVFGEKDFQQLMVIREMVDDLHMAVEIISGPTVRDDHGLALSSRNAYLSEKELAVARQLNVILKDVAKGALSVAEAKKKITAAGFDEVQYVAERWGRVLGAVKLGRTRLIDNVEI